MPDIGSETIISSRHVLCRCSHKSSTPRSPQCLARGRRAGYRRGGRLVAAGQVAPRKAERLACDIGLRAERKAGQLSSDFLDYMRLLLVFLPAASRSPTPILAAATSRASARSRRKATGFSSTMEYRRATTVVEKGTPELVVKTDTGSAACCFSSRRGSARTAPASITCASFANVCRDTARLRSITAAGSATASTPNPGVSGIDFPAVLIIETRLP